MLHIAPRRRAGYPLADPVRQRGAPVQTHADFASNQRHPACHARHKPRVQLLRGGFHQPAFDLDTGGAQAGNTLPCHLRIRVLHRHHHPRHPGTNQRIGAGRRSAVMTARLQRDIYRRPPRRRTRFAQGIHFGMWLAGLFVPAAAEQFALPHQHATDTRIGTGTV